MRSRVGIILILGVAGILLSFPALCQQAKKPLTDEDIIAMVKNGMPESVVISAIQSQPGNFKTSTQDLIRLHKAGVTENELNAMMAAGKASAATPTTANPSPANGGPANSSPAAPVATPPATTSRMPKVYLAQNGGLQELPLEKTQLAETKTKPSSMKSLAADSTISQALQSGVNTVAWDAASHMNSSLGGSTVQQAGSVFSGVLSRRKPTVTYVWGVPNPASPNVLQVASPIFTVDFSRAPGVKPDDYEPAIVKLTPAQNTCRIVGATQGKEDIRSTPAADWQIYSHFLEERVNAHAEKQAAGKYKLSAASELLPGEYAVVLRPVSKSKGFSGGDVARAQGDGLMFDAVWTFQVSDSAQ